jgi:GH25 family lysozyme M1 (1,4-beta-N-acetylmuramidase)
VFETRHAAPSRAHVLVAAMLLALLASAFTFVAAPSDVLGASTTKVAACGANLRKTASTRGVLRTSIKSGTKVTVVATVSGGTYRTTCAGRVVSGSKWYRITAINGKSVKTLYGLSYLYGASALFKSVTVPTTKVAACGVNLRKSASTSGIFRTKINTGSTVTVSMTVSGGSYRTTCAGTAVSGSKWYRITAINGKTVKSLYGLSYLYGASGLFKAAATPPPPPPPGATTEGIDVSHWQGPIDWNMVRAAGKQFAFMKASEDIDFVDDMYLVNRVAAKAAGLFVGAYHFAQPDLTPGDGVAEADHFLDTAQPVSGELLPVLDLEVSGGLNPTQLQEWVKAYLGRIYERTGLRGVIYMSPAFWQTYAGDTTWFALNGYKVLWIAHWTTAAEPWVAAADWAGQGWTFWQYTSSGTVPGIAGRVDLDRFGGTDFTNVLIH